LLFRSLGHHLRVLADLVGFRCDVLVRHVLVAQLGDGLKEALMVVRVVAGYPAW
jgi:hypothetical protein